MLKNLIQKKTFFHAKKKNHLYSYQIIDDDFTEEIEVEGNYPCSSENDCSIVGECGAEIFAITQIYERRNLNVAGNLFLWIKKNVEGGYSGSYSDWLSWNKDYNPNWHLYHDRLKSLDYWSKAATVV
jgi:hypothetical protein